ncbi:hypothetical protein COOONC_17185 [Cooperia oncophora]
MTMLRSANSHVPAFGENAASVNLRQLPPGHDLHNLQAESGLDSNSFRDFQEVTNQACVYGECTLSCLRTNFNMKCGNSVGAMISEALIRPLVEGHQKFSPLFVALGMITPKSCSFLYQGSRLLQHRIDPKINEELHRIFGKPDEKDESTKTTNVPAPDAINADSDLEYLNEADPASDIDERMCFAYLL